MQTTPVGARGHCFAIPVANVLETISLDPQAIRPAGRKEIFKLRGHMESLVRLDEFFKLPRLDDEPADPKPRLRPVVVVESVEKRVGFMVDELIGRKEMVIKSLGGLLQGIPCLAGATILGDGRVVLWLRELGAEHATLDGNHPLAGQTLEVDIELLGVETT